MKHMLFFLIRCYQICLSPFLGNCCRFSPTCSEYALDAIRSYGALKGMWLTLKRILKCGPWHNGGYDPISFIDKESSKSSHSE